MMKQYELKVPVAMTTITAEHAADEKVASMYVNAGGFWAIRMKNAAIGKYLAACGDSMTEERKTEFLKQKNPPVIFVAIDMASKMKPEYMTAILVHEEAHCVLGHLPEIVDEDAPMEVMFDLTKELEADAYAANIVGARVMIRALKEIMRVKASYAHPENIWKRFLFHMTIYGDKMMTARLKALRAMRHIQEAKTA